MNVAVLGHTLDLQESSCSSFHLFCDWLWGVLIWKHWFLEWVLCFENEVAVWILLCLSLIFLFFFFFNLFSSTRATPHTPRRSNPSCPQQSGRRDGSRVRRTTWERTHLTISKKSLILSSNKEVLNSDLYWIFFLFLFFFFKTYQHMCLKILSKITFFFLTADKAMIKMH